MNMNIPIRPPLRLATVADLIRHFGDIPAARIRLDPYPGLATIADVIGAEQGGQPLCELVDGVLVEKPMGFVESRLAAVLIAILEDFAFQHDLGIVCGEAAMMCILPGLVRIPDVCFIAWDRLPGRKLPVEPVPELVPNLAVEVLSKSNTLAEMERKLREYFQAGVERVWLVDGAMRTIRVHSSAKKSRLYRDGDTLRGGKLLPGFSLALAPLFDRSRPRR